MKITATGFAPKLQKIGKWPVLLFALLSIQIYPVMVYRIRAYETFSFYHREAVLKKSGGLPVALGYIMLKPTPFKNNYERVVNHSFV